MTRRSVQCCKSSDLLRCVPADIENLGYDYYMWDCAFLVVNVLTFCGGAAATYPLIPPPIPALLPYPSRPSILLSH